MSNLDKLIAQQKARVENPEMQRCEVLLGGELVLLEVVKLPPRKWLDMAATAPPRPGSEMDAQLGFNAHVLANDYPTGYRKYVVDEVAEDISDEQWAEMMRVMDPIHIDTVASAIWTVNVYVDQVEVAAARKALAAARSKKRSSRAS